MERGSTRDHRRYLSVSENPYIVDLYEACNVPNCPGHYRGSTRRPPSMPAIRDEHVHRVIICRDCTSVLDHAFPNGCYCDDQCSCKNTPFRIRREEVPGPCNHCPSPNRAERSVCSSKRCLVCVMVRAGLPVLETESGVQPRITPSRHTRRSDADSRDDELTWPCKRV